jgi:hypothetical protein
MAVQIGRSLVNFSLKQALNALISVVLAAFLVAGPIRAADPPSTAATKDIDAAPAAPDPLFTRPYTDSDEWRATPVRHRYVHGGFAGTDTRFSFYFPEKARYQGRFFQYVTPVPDNENLAQTPGDDKIGFAVASGAYFVETNSGGVSATAGPAFRVDPKIAAFRANAATARYSRTIAAQMYGPRRIYGYLYGGSGGGYRTLGSMENTNGVWDGAVPFVLGSPMAAPNVFAVRMHAMRILKDKFPQIVDAMDAGGSGNPYAGLNEEESAALREVTAMGFPLKSWFGHKTMGVHAFTALYQGMVMADPQYFEDFWTVPGYLGANPPESLKKARLQFVTKIKVPLSSELAAARGIDGAKHDGLARGSADAAWKIVISDGTARPVAIQLEATPPLVDFLGGDLFILSGEAKGKRLALREIIGDAVTLGVVDSKTLALLKPGDEVRVDNSNFLAAQTYHRHQVPDASYTVWDQFRGQDGKPTLPQRKINLGPLFAMGAAGTVPTGKFNGKIIVVDSLLDREAFPWQADWYRQRFDENLGKDGPNRYRLWYTENALHSWLEDKDAPTRVVSYLPLLQQALRDLSAWVEKGVAPPATTNYKVVDGQVIVPARARDRRGIQPTILLTADGGTRAGVKPGQTVHFTATVEVPPGTGKIVSVEWDYEETGKFPDQIRLSGAPKPKLVLKGSYRFDKPGTYFTTLRIASQRTGDGKTPYARIVNLARVRVVVE